MQEEDVIIDALAEFGLPPAAVRNLIRRAKQKSGPLLTPGDWARFLQGPLLQEIRAVIPVFQPVGAYAEAIARFESAPPPAGAPPPVAAEPRAPVRRVDLSDEKARQQLLSDVAREEGALGVMLIWPGGALMRFPGASKTVAALLYAAHRLLARRPYKVGYIVFEDAVLLARPLGRYLLVVVAKREANLGRFMTRLLEVEEGGKA